MICKQLTGYWSRGTGVANQWKRKRSQAAITEGSFMATGILSLAQDDIRISFIPLVREASVICSGRDHPSSSCCWHGAQCRSLPDNSGILNRLKRSGYCTYHLLNTLKNSAFCSRFVRFWQYISPNSINRMVFLMETQCVYTEAGAQFGNIIRNKFML